MDNIFLLILNLSIFILIGKYISDLKSDSALVIVLLLFGLTVLGHILSYTFQTPIFITFGYFAGMIVSPIIFSIYLFRQKGNKEDKLFRRLMLIPTITLLVFYLAKFLHLPVLGAVYFLMIISMLVGGWIIIKKPGLKEIQPFQIVLIFLIVDILSLVFA